LNSGKHIYNDDLSSANYINWLYQTRKESYKITNLSIRLLASRGGFSASTFSRILSGKISVSLDMADKLYRVLKLSSQEHDHLKKIILYESSNDEDIKTVIAAQITRSSMCFKGMLDIESENIEKILSDSHLSKRLSYYSQEKLEFRTLNLLDDGNGGVRKDFFYDTFFSVKHSCASSGFFMRQEEGTFNAYLSSFDESKKRVFSVGKENRGIDISFSKCGLPIISLVTFHYFGSSNVALFNVKYMSDKLILKGELYNRYDKSKIENLSIQYERLD